MPPRRGIVWHHGWHDWMILLRQEISTMLSLAHVNSLAAGRRHGSWCCNMCTHAVDMQYMPRCKHWHAACCFSSQGYAPLLWWQQALQGPGLAARPGSDADKMIPWSSSVCLANSVLGRWGFFEFFIELLRKPASLGTGNRNAGFPKAGFCVSSFRSITENKVPIWQVRST